MNGSDIIKYQTTEAIFGGILSILVLIVLGWLALRAYKMYLDNQRKHFDADLRDVYIRISDCEGRIDKCEYLSTEADKKVHMLKQNFNELNLSIDNLNKQSVTHKEDNNG